MSDRDKETARVAVLMLKGMLADASDEERQKYNAARAALVATMNTHGEFGELALQILALEQASEA